MIDVFRLFRLWIVRQGPLILQKTADITNRGRSCKRKNPSAGVFKTFPAVTVTELFLACTRHVTLLRSFARVKKMIHCLFCHRPNGHCLCFEIFCIVRQICGICSSFTNGSRCFVCKRRWLATRLPWKYTSTIVFVTRMSTFSPIRLYGTEYLFRPSLTR